MARLEAKRKQQTQSAGSETTKLIRKTRQGTREHLLVRKVAAA